MASVADPDQAYLRTAIVLRDLKRCGCKATMSYWYEGCTSSTISTEFTTMRLLRSQEQSQRGQRPLVHGFKRSAIIHGHQYEPIARNDCLTYHHKSLRHTGKDTTLSMGPALLDLEKEPP